MGLQGQIRLLIPKPITILKARVRPRPSGLNQPAPAAAPAPGMRTAAEAFASTDWSEQVLLGQSLHTKMTSALYLDGVLRQHGFAPPSVPPAGISALERAQLETELSLKLSTDLSDLYEYSSQPFLGWRDKKGRPMPGIYFLMSHPLPWKEILPTWHLQRGVQKTLDDGLAYMMPYEQAPQDVYKACNNDPGWIPIGQDWTNCHVILDMAPGPAGTLGQIFWKSGEDWAKELLAPSLNQYLMELAQAIEGGLVHASDGSWIDPSTGDSLDRLPRRNQG